jgi:antitoxin PrlF
MAEIRIVGHSAKVYLSFMVQKITVGRRGSITLPAGIRKRFKLEQNDELIVEETDQGLLLRPSVSMPIEIYTDKRIAEFSSDEAAIGKILDRLPRA